MRERDRIDRRQLLAEAVEEVWWGARSVEAGAGRSNSVLPPEPIG
jgi:hypothetical protein